MGKLSTRDLLHGAALLQLARENHPLTVERKGATYVIDDGKLSAYLKITTKQGKAQFTFSPENIEELKEAQRQSPTFYLGLISPGDGVCALTWEELTEIIAIESGRGKTLLVKRMHRSRFRVTGSDSDKELIIPGNRWSPYLIPL